MSNVQVRSFEAMTTEELDVMSQQLLQTRISRMTEEVERIKDAQEKQKTEFELYKEDQKRKQNELEQLAKASMRSKEAHCGWVTLREFGKQYTTSISNRRVGKLLRVVGLAIRDRNSTVPYRNHVGKERYAVQEVFDGRAATLWNYKRCSEWIDMWLEKNGYFSQFYTILANGSVKEINAFIDRLHSEYGTKK